MNHYLMFQFHIVFNDIWLYFWFLFYFLDPPESVVIIPDSPTNAKEFICTVDSNPEPNDYIWTR